MSDMPRCPYCPAELGWAGETTHIWLHIKPTETALVCTAGCRPWAFVFQAGPQRIVTPPTAGAATSTTEGQA